MCVYITVCGCVVLHKVFQCFPQQTFWTFVWRPALWASPAAAVIYQPANPDLLLTGLPSLQQTSMSLSKPRRPFSSQATGLYCG